MLPSTRVSLRQLGTQESSKERCAARCRTRTPLRETSTAEVDGNAGQIFRNPPGARYAYGIDLLDSLPAAVCRSAFALTGTSRFEIVGGPS